jgi:hypothetical protein
MTEIQLAQKEQFAEMFLCSTAANLVKKRKQQTH